MSDRITREQWIDRIRIDSPHLLGEMMQRDGQPVSIIHTNETGEWQWAVSCEDEFWMDAFPTEQEARNFVEAMGWPLLK